MLPQSTRTSCSSSNSLLLLLTCIVAAVINVSTAAARETVGLIYPGSQTHFGTWGDFEYCQLGTYVTGFQLKTEKNQGNGDDTALNGITLSCGSRGGKSISSRVGLWGKNGQEFKCGGGFTGAQFRSECSLGSDGDDTSGNNLAMLCSTNGVWRKGDGGSFGDWGNQVTCPSGSTICGLRTRLEESLGPNEDDTALNEVEFACCL